MRKIGGHAAVLQPINAMKPAPHSSIETEDCTVEIIPPVSNLGHSRPGSSQQQFGHVRYAAESGSKLGEIAALPTGYCGLMALPET